MNKSMLCAGLLALFAVQVANAANCIWTGGGANSNWSNSANWNNCGGAHAVPVDGDSLGFPDAVPNPTNNNDLVKLKAAQLVIAGPVNISGNTIGLSGGISAAVPLAAASPVVNLGIVLETNPQTFQCSGAHKSLTLGGTINLNGNALTLDSACSILLTGKITGDGSITKIGATTAFLEGSTSNYTGVTTINAGRVRLVSSTALGASGAGNETVVNDGAALELEDTATDDDLTLSGSGIGNQGALVGAGGNNTVTGAITLEANTRIGSASSGTALTIEGPIGGGVVVLTKVGAGTVRLQDVSTYGGGTLVESGTLEVNGVVGVAAVSAGTWAGNGMSTDTVSLTGGTFSPGTAGGTNVGTFDMHDFVWLGGEFAFQLGGDTTHSDHVVVTGGFVKPVGGAFEVHFSDGAAPPVPGVVYALVSFTSTTFAPGDFSFTYTGTGPGSSMTGTFAMTATELQFTPATVVSDLVFHAGFE